MQPESIARSVASYFSAVGTRNADEWLESFAEDAESHDPGLGEPLRGKDALRDYFVATSNAFASIEMTPDNVFVNGIGAAVKFTGRARNQDGREVTFEGIDVFEFDEGGKIKRMWGYWDPAAMLAQLRVG